MKNNVYKNILFSAVFLFVAYFFSPSISLASITFDPVSPQTIGTNINVTSTTGSIIYIYRTADGLIDSMSNDGGTINTSGSAVTKTFVECNDVIDGNTCSSHSTFSSIEEMESDLGYVGKSDFTWTDDIPPSPTPDSPFFSSTCTVADTVTQCDYTGALFYMIFVFFFLWYFEFIYSFFAHLAQKFL